MAKDIAGRNVPTGGGKGDVKPSYYKSMNKFPKLTHKIYTTARYADVFPTFYFHGTRGDKVPLNSSHELDTYTLKSPLKSDVRFNKTYIKVPYKAIYPHNWELLRVPPISGDDLNEFDVRAVLPVRKYVDNCVDSFIESFEDFQNYSDQDVEFDESNFCISLTRVIKSVLLLEMFMSDGSLFSSFNIHFGDYFFRKYFPNGIDSNNLNWDNWINNFFDGLSKGFLSYTSDGFTVRFGVNDLSLNEDFVEYKVVHENFLGRYQNAISFRTAIDMMRNEDFIISTAHEQYRNHIDVDPMFLFIDYVDVESSKTDLDINIEPIIAYQLACYQFFTDDKVDFIYDADLYRKYILSELRKLSGPDSVPKFFDWNGHKLEYDVFSREYWFYLPSKVPGYRFTEAYALMIAVFGYRRSLRYKDYFTSGRPQPLAVGTEYSAFVNENEVSAVDIAKSMQYTRFYHNVSLAGRRLADYLQMIVPGKRIEASDEQPHWLAHESFVLKGFEVENTGTAQLSDSDPNIITTNLKSNGSKFSFMTEVDDQCIILGLGSFDIARIYSRTIDKFAFHHNRYDDFIPQLQFIGDQEVSNVEIGSLDNKSPFSYTVRHKEYKEKYNFASGGFINFLPSWAMITDNTDGIPPTGYINPLYIRAVPSEFDRFYKSLTGYSLASYFHFILVIKNDLTNCERAMIPAPEILK